MRIKYSGDRGLKKFLIFTSLPELGCQWRNAAMHMLYLTENMKFHQIHSTEQILYGEIRSFENIILIHDSAKHLNKSQWKFTKSCLFRWYISCLNNDIFFVSIRFRFGKCGYHHIAHIRNHKMRDMPCSSSSNFPIQNPNHCRRSTVYRYNILIGIGGNISC